MSKDLTMSVNNFRYWPSWMECMYILHEANMELSFGEIRRRIKKHVRHSEPDIVQIIESLLIKGYLSRARAVNRNYYSFTPQGAVVARMISILKNKLIEDDSFQLIEGTYNE